MRQELPAEFVRWARDRGLEGLLVALDDQAAAPVSVRLNAEKITTRAAIAALGLPIAGPVSWVPEHTAGGSGGAFYLRERPIFTADPVFHGGAYYVQQAGSMSVGALLEREILGASHSSHRSLRVLDLCAAPGGKTTHVASVLKAHAAGVVVANEVIRARAGTLTENVQKWGTGNVLVTSNDPADFGARLPDCFDVLVVDAPCSGEGMFRTDPAARAEWSVDNVRLCAARQRRIVGDAWPALCGGGVLLYSTCTFNERENEENVRWMVRELGGELLHESHFYPHRVQSEGFYVAAICKTGDGGTARARLLKSGKGGKGGKGGGKGGALAPVSAAAAAELSGWMSDGVTGQGSVFGMGRDGQVYGYATLEMRLLTEALLDRRFNLLYSGVQLGELIRTGLKPSPALALYGGLRRDRAGAAAALSAAAAAEYLRKGTSPELLPPTLFSEGLNLLTYNDVALGWAKRIGSRLNNLYPSGWRVRHY